MKYIVDSFQLFMLCDKNAERYLLRNGLNKTVNLRGKDRFSMPIIYCDNTLSTINKEKHLRKYAFPSNLVYDEKDQNNWIDKFNGVIIPSENFEIDIEDQGENIKLEMVHTSDYHLEHKYKLSTDMTKWENWFAIYIPVKTAIQIVKDLGFESIKRDLKNKKESHKIYHEPKITSGKREDMYYQKIPVEYYQFNYETFEQANLFLRKNGFMGEFRSIVYKRRFNLNVSMKVGFVHTREFDGDFERNPQIALKLSQTKYINGTKPRGVLELTEDKTNYVILNKHIFIKSIMLAILGISRGVSKNGSTRALQREGTS